MKRLLLFILVVMSLTVYACVKDDFLTKEIDLNFPERELYSAEKQGVITKLHQVEMRRELIIPFSVYVMQVNNCDYLYMLRLRFNQDLKIGDVIYYSASANCPNEIAKINDCYLGESGEANQNADDTSIGYLVATDPIETGIKNIFSMQVIYSVTFLPIPTLFIETTDGNLVFIKKSKVKVPLAVGDRIVYSRYTLYDELLMLKKL